MSGVVISSSKLVSASKASRSKACISSAYCGINSSKPTTSFLILQTFTILVDSVIRVSDNSRGNRSASKLK